MLVKEEFPMDPTLFITGIIVVLLKYVFVYLMEVVYTIS